jgi:hypothetical protein
MTSSRSTRSSTVTIQELSRFWRGCKGKLRCSFEHSPAGNEEGVCCGDYSLRLSADLMQERQRRAMLVPEV